MDIVKPIYVYKWVSSKEYIKYVIGNNDSIAATGAAATATIVIKENIYQDSSKEDALNKIAYYINKQSGKDDKTPYYAWIDKDRSVSEPFLYDITVIKWKGYDVNPFKSTDRKSNEIKEAIDKRYIKSKELFETTDVINIVFKTEFIDDNKYYFDNNRFKSNNYKVASDSKITDLYKLKIENNNKLAEEYYNVLFSARMAETPALIILFDKLATSRKIQLIQYVNTNISKVYYKLYKNHTFKNKKELNRIFKVNNDGKESINIYYTKNTDIVITIYANGVINLKFNYQIDNGIALEDILKYVSELNKYISDVLNDTIVFKERYINARIRYNVYKTKLDELKDKLKTSSIFTAAKDEEFYYKRTGNYKDRSAVDKKLKDAVNNNNIKIAGKDDAEVLDTRIILRKEARGYMIDVKNAKSFFEFRCLDYWVSKIIESAVNIKQSTNTGDSTSPVNANAVDANDDKSVGSDNSDRSTPPQLRYKYMDSSSESSGGASYVGGVGTDNKNYLINKLKNADRALWNDNNKSRKCQKVKQPIPLSMDEYNDFKSKGYDKIVDNSLIHNNNHYICPRLWCPKSNIPLDEGNPKAKCPGADEKPMRLNEEMKNNNKPRYAYLKKKDNIPCCGKKMPSDAGDDSDDGNDGNDAGAANSMGVTRVTRVTPDIPKSPKAPKKPPAIPANDKNYIMKNYPIYYNKRFGDIPEELYKILYPNDYKEYLDSCRSPNNINKKRCILRKGLVDIDEIPVKYANHYDNIINTLVYLLDETKESFIENIKNKIDLFAYLSLENGNICRDFGDIQPVLYEYNKGLYRDLKKHIKNMNKNRKDGVKIALPAFDSKNDKVVFQISRLLYIYKSYRKFIEYISADNYPDDKGVQYLYSLTAFLYKRLLIVWENTINTSSTIPNINMLAPEYINDIICYYGLPKKTEIVMILKESWKVNGEKDDNNNKNRDNKLYEIMKDRDNIYFYEPLVIKTLNMEKKHMALSEYPNIRKIINHQPNNSTNTNIFNNLKHINNLATFNGVKKANGARGTNGYTIDTIIINANYTIDKMMLANHILIRFNPQGTIILPYLIKELNVKNVVFLDDIIGDTHKITIINSVHSKFLNKLNKLEELGITVDSGVNNFSDSQITKSVLTIRNDDYDTKGRLILFGKKNEFEEYNDRNTRSTNKWLELRLHVRDKLIAILEDKDGNDKITEYSKKPRAEFIKYLMSLFSNSDSDKDKIQIILEEIPIFAKVGVNDWYARSLLQTKYGYVNELSDNFVDNGTELLFTQYLAKKNIPKNILYYHEANPNIRFDIHGDSIINYDNIYEDMNSRDSRNSGNAKVIKAVNAANAEPPKIFEGEAKDLNSKWTKYKKKIWWRLKYIKNVYVASNIAELFNYFKALDNDIVNEYEDIIKKTFQYYKYEFNKNKEDVDAKNIKDIFRDPYFYSSYVNAMNHVNNTKKTFKTLEIFLSTYFYNSAIDERKSILKHIKGDDKYIYHPNENTFFTISKILNISILIIHSRAEYGKAVDVSKRADDKDLSITTSIYKANNGELSRPLLMLYKKNEKTHLSYYIIRNSDHDNFIYNELKDAPEEIKAMILNTEKTSVYNSYSSTQTSSI